MSISRRSLIKTAIGVGCVGAGYSLGVDLLKDPLQKLDQDLSKAIEDFPAASISAAIIKDRRLIWHNNYGYQDIESRIMMSADSAWQTIGSISKLVVWIALMQLIETGRLDMERDISDYLGFPLRSPHYPNTEITTYHLMTHSSSLSSRKLMSRPYPMADSFCLDSSQTLAQWVNQFVNPQGESYQASQIFDDYQAGDFASVTPDPLGVFAGYSNLNAVIGAYLVECISGLEFSHYCDIQIFEPSGMLQTSWNKNKPLEWITHYEAEHTPRAPIMQVYSDAMVDQGYTDQRLSLMPNGEKYLSFVNCDYYSPVYPMGLLGTSMQSLLPLFLAFLNQGKYKQFQLLQTNSVKQMLTPQRRDNANGMSMGLGWFEKQDRFGNRYWGHEGGGPGVISSVFIDPDTGCGVSLFINNFYVDYRLRERLLTDMYDIARTV